MSTKVTPRNDILLPLKLFKIAIVLVTFQIIFLNFITTTKSFQASSFYDNPSGETLLPDELLSSSVKKKKNDSGNGDGKPLNDLVDAALDLLFNAGVTLDVTTKEELITSLSKSNYYDLYGKEVIILGNESCQTFRDKVPAAERFAAPMGMFNTGTNLMYHYLQANCAIKEKQEIYGESSRGMHMQPSWGKHSPSILRGHNKAKLGGREPCENFFPVIILKDPFTFMSSLCRHSYQASWPRFGKNRCPNLVPLDEREWMMNGRKPSVGVIVGYNSDPVIYSSMVDLWNTWYDDYVLKVDFPRMIIRFEDFLFHTEEIVTQVCDCVGGQMNSNFSYIAESSKKMDGASDLLESILKYANTDNRFKEFTDKDKAYAMENLQPDLIEMFHYKSW